MTATACVAALSACSSSGDEERGSIGFVEGFLGGVVADEPRAALVGRDVLSAGGHAADAAVAMYFAMAVTYPSSASLGGGGVCLVYDHDSGEARALEFLARAPATPQAGVERPVAVPGNVRGFAVLHSRYGRLRWSQLLAPAETLARFGIQVSRAFDRQAAPVADALMLDREARRVFAAGGAGRLVGEGEFLRQFDLAAVLGRLRAQGAGAFYTGALARQMVDAVRQAGGRIGVDDLRDYAPRWLDTIEVRFGNETVHFAPPPAAGGAVAAQMWTLLADGDRLEDAPAEARNHVLAETASRAFAGRASWMRDDGSSSVDAAELVEDDRIDALADGFRLDRHVAPSSLGLAPAARPENPAGASFVAIDRDGSAAACAVTLNSLFGVGRVAPGTGIVPASLPGPGGRGATAFGPMLVVNHNVDEFYFAASATGGSAAPSALVGVAARTLMLETPLDDAVATRRVHHGGAPDLTYHEPDLGAPLVQSLVWRGHQVAATPSLGRVNAIACTGGIPPKPETCAVAADPRGFGLAASAD